MTGWLVIDSVVGDGADVKGGVCTEGELLALGIAGDGKGPSIISRIVFAGVFIEASTGDVLVWICSLVDARKSAIL